MSLPYLHSLYIYHDWFLKMASTTLQEILSCVDEDRHWTSVLMVVQSNGERLDVSSAARGRNSTYPAGATDQPEKGWPRTSCYRFPIKFHGIGMWGNLKEMLTFWNVFPGCKLYESQSCHTSRTSALQLGSWTLECTKHRVQAPMKVGTFVPDKMAQQGIAEQTLKRKKPKGTKAPGILSMHNKSVKKTLIAPEVNEAAAERVKNSRVGSSRSESNETKCKMRLNIFLSFDNYFYLSKTSSLKHNDHPYIPPEAISRGEKDLDMPEKDFMNILYEHRVSNNAIGKIMQTIKGKSFGNFIPKSIYRMNQKTENMLNLAEGITADMSDAQKTLKKLEV